MPAAKKKAASKKKAAAKKRAASKGGSRAQALDYNHWRVVDYWIKYGGHKYAAYMRFYPNSSYRNARTRSGELFSRPEVLEYIESERDRLQRESEIDKAGMIQRYLALAEVDVNRIFDEQGGLLPMHQWPPEITRAMVGVDSAGLPKFEGRKGAYDSVARILGHFAEDNKQQASTVAEAVANLVSATRAASGMGMPAPHQIGPDADRDPD